MRRRHIHMQRLGQHPMLHRQRHLDDSGYPGRGRGMPHVRFDRAQPQGLFAGPGTVLPIGGQNRLGLNGIAQGGPGAVAFDHIHIGQTQPGTGQRRANHSLL